MNDKQQNIFEPDYSVHPGETLKECMEYDRVSIDTLSRDTGIPIQTLQGIINGSLRITEEIALQLGYVTGVPSSFWNSLQAQYDEQTGKE